ncbi:hypothetical protein [Paraburkholderia pallida]|uniref:Uncharacterized protein n=1 Tax=Paraburkholderia pallida TaxID=2547399 RepID=A0A4V1AZU4_9BURK|nr:hypothetical protein [Paraburkholderia pallida]QBR00483.1 hypothetical protein E1956_25960 [Paraburkholderia pallida]
MMRWRTEVFRGRVMTACIDETIDEAGLMQVYITRPYGYYTPPHGSLRQPDIQGHSCGPFTSVYAAYAAAFNDCRRCILQDVTREIVGHQV